MDRASVDPPLRAADRVVVLGDVPPAWIPWSAGAVRFPHEHPSARERLDVDGLLRWARPHVPAHGRLVVVTDGDLFIPECESLLGFSQYRGKVAIVSTARLATTDPAQTRRRIANAVTHELGHLDGLRHCTRACVMRPAAHAAELDNRPAVPCGRCPRRRSPILTIAASVVVLLVVVGVAGRLLDRRVPAGPPAVPADVAALLERFPVDPGTVASRPVDIVVRRLDANGLDASMTALTSTLPSGLDRAGLSRASASIASALYRTPESQPIVHVHAFEARGDLAEVIRALRTAGAAAVVRPYPPRHAMLVVAPAPGDREMAARLTSSLDAGGGLQRDADVSLMLGALPARLPAGWQLDSLSVTNVHRMPEAINDIARRFFPDDGPAAATEIRRVMPLMLVTAEYRSGAGTHAGVALGYYGLAVSAWMSRRALTRTLQPWDAGEIDLASGRARRLIAGARQYALWQHGRFVAAVYADGSETSEVLLRALADALQL